MKSSREIFRFYKTVWCMYSIISSSFSCMRDGLTMTQGNTYVTKKIEEIMRQNADYEKRKMYAKRFPKLKVKILLDFFCVWAYELYFLKLSIKKHLIIEGRLAYMIVLIVIVCVCLCPYVIWLSVRLMLPIFFVTTCFVPIQSVLFVIRIILYLSITKSESIFQVAHSFYKLSRQNNYDLLTELMITDRNSAEVDLTVILNKIHLRLDYAIPCYLQFNHLLFLSIFLFGKTNNCSCVGTCEKYADTNTLKWGICLTLHLGLE